MLQQEKIGTLISIIDVCNKALHAYSGKVMVNPTVYDAVNDLLIAATKKLEEHIPDL